MPKFKVIKIIEARNSEDARQTSFIGNNSLGCIEQLKVIKMGKKRIQCQIKCNGHICTHGGLGYCLFTDPLGSTPVIFRSRARAQIMIKSLITINGGKRADYQYQIEEIVN